MRYLKLTIILFILFFISAPLYSQGKSSKVSILLFWGKGCPHCEKEKIFLKDLQKKHPFVQVEQYEIWGNKKNRDLLKSISKDLNIRTSSIPITIIGNKHYVVGFNSANSTGREIERFVLSVSNSSQKKNSIENSHTNSIPSAPESISVPLFGEINLKSLSLPLLTISLGAIDGFNPCAMWVLLMLLSFLMATESRKKLIALGTIFIVASAAVYFVFMVAWLNLIFFIGFIPIVKVIIGSIAILGGAYYLKEFFTNKENICKVTGSEQKKKISEKISYYINNKGFYLAAIAIIILAFFVNLIELICSAGLPAIYTQVLSLSSLTPLQYYSYISLYIFVFMLDNIVIFLIAVFTLRLSSFTSKYSHYSHLIGGTILLVLGTLLIFKPEWLMFG